ncbi:T3SS effector HopA1 family protein [Mesorhizobium cantuariense]|uniref:T3SS effector HopA1 family protein n=1 Tax=Mesorhizobium cantuariense TaxID=1300275 RepID=A0ABV7N0B0_9HYPH
MAALHPDWLAAIDAAEILGPTRYRVLEQVRNVPAGEGEAPGSTQHRRRPPPPLLRAFEAELYARLYVRPGLVEPARITPEADRDFVIALSAANCGRGGWEPGWTIAAPTGVAGQIGVMKDGLIFRVAWHDVRASPGGLHAGKPCRVRIAKEFRNLMPHFYVAVGDGDTGEPEPRPAMRIYWHLTAEAAAPFISSVTQHLNAHGVPFRAKVLRAPQAYHRADAGVLYLEPRWYRRAGNLLAIVYREVADGLRAETPLFARRLARGLAHAEDPGNGQSFGQHRCHLVALAGWSSFARHETMRAARAATLAAIVRAAGLDPSRPHLGPGSRDYHAVKQALDG